MSPPILTHLIRIVQKYQVTRDVTRGQQDTRIRKRREIDLCHIYCLIRDALPTMFCC